MVPCERVRVHGIVFVQMVGVITWRGLGQWDGSFHGMVIYFNWFGSVGGLSPWDG